MGREIRTGWSKGVREREKDFLQRFQFCQFRGGKKQTCNSNDSTVCALTNKKGRTELCDECCAKKHTCLLVRMKMVMMMMNRVAKFAVFIPAILTLITRMPLIFTD